MMAARVAAAAAVALTARTGAVAGMSLSSVAGVPERMMLSPSMRSADLTTSPLIPLDIDVKSTSVEELSPVVSSEVLKKHAGKHGSVCFVVRRPG